MNKILDVKKIRFAGLVVKKNFDSKEKIFKLEEIFKLEKILKKFEVEILLENCTAKLLDRNGLEFEELIKKSDFLISLGGDGTLISICRRAYRFNPFVLGIHSGNLGFLTEITIDKAADFFADFFDGKFEIEQPFMLELEFKFADKDYKKIAFNDAVINTKHSLAKIEAYLNGRKFNYYFGDGLIISSPVGSTAYNMSAGGAILHPLSKVFALTPICSHSLTQRPLILPENFEIELKILNDCDLVLDGQEIYDLNKNSSIKAKISKTRAKLIRKLDRNYFDVLKEKLNWGYNA